MSEEAFELINGFYNGVDVLVRELAEQIAVDAESYLPDQPSVVAIEKEHVAQAGCQVVNALRQLLKDRPLPRELTDLVEGMSDCCKPTSGE